MGAITHAEFDWHLLQVAAHGQKKLGDLVDPLSLFTGSALGNSPAQLSVSTRWILGTALGNVCG
jgi:hypothetical protein